METIYIADLSAGQLTARPYDILAQGDYGRGLAHRLLEEYASPRAGRLDPDNALVLVPGLFAGCPAPSAGRMTLLAKGGVHSVQVCNLTGNMPQKLGSLDIAGVVIKGKDPRGGAVLHLSGEGAELLHMPELSGLHTQDMLDRLKARFGREAAIVGTGMAGDMGMSLSTVFCTYPDGEPEYNCPRNGFGDVPGSKGLRAVVVTGRDYFARTCADRPAFQAAGKELAVHILDNEICSGALPSYGSVTLIRLLQQQQLPQQPPTPPKQVPRAKPGCKINYCCAPMCVIGCLNRHSASTGEHYASPDQSELATALKNCFGMEDNDFVLRLQDRLRSLCLVSPEFVTAARCYFAATDTAPSPQALLDLVDEMERGTPTGRLVASRAQGVADAFPHRPELQALVDRPAIADEGDFTVKLSRPSPRFQALSDLELLYCQIFLLENLGLCLFASFALVNSGKALSLLAKLYRYRTGQAVTGDELILYAQQCIRRELDYLRRCGAPDPKTNVPAFTRVLYRYFSQKTEKTEE